MQEIHFSSSGGLVKLYVVGDPSYITIPFWDLVVQDKSTPPYRGHELRDEAVILVGIIGTRSQHEISVPNSGNVLESLFHGVPMTG